jgi:hypothetical protein
MSTLSRLSFNCDELLSMYRAPPEEEKIDSKLLFIPTKVV